MQAHVRKSLVPVIRNKQPETILKHNRLLKTNRNENIDLWQKCYKYVCSSKSQKLRPIIDVSS